MRFLFRTRKKMRPANTPIPRMTPIATPALAPPDIPDEAIAVGDEEAAGSAVALDVAAKRFASWLVSALVEAEVVKDDGAWVVSEVIVAVV